MEMNSDISKIKKKFEMMVLKRGGGPLQKKKKKNIVWEKNTKRKKSSRGYINSFYICTPTRLAVEKDCQSFLLSALKEM